MKLEKKIVTNCKIDSDSHEYIYRFTKWKSEKKKT